ncbi:MAG: toxic anion resistance protein [Gammaproteobacteria bacterium]|nr:toxic anion resistance protein [Gammaproteobacteria bacterium]MCP5414921.1 toxic anion resistance protein [Chromatiaceae bacterium]
MDKQAPERTGSQSQSPPESLSDALTDPRASQPLEPARVTELLAELDLNDSHSILFFGSRAQEQLTTVSDSMLERVRTKDVGPAGAALNDMVLTLRGFDLGGLDPNRKAGWFDRLLGKGRDAAKVLQRYEQVRDQIEAITDRLEQHKTSLLHDIEALDRLYAANLDYFHTLELYIAAGEQKLVELDDQVIPKLAEQVAAGDDTLAAQRLRDLRALRDDLERRVHDLHLTRQVTMQSLPSIRLVQENDKSLVGKINSTLVNTVPLWRQQLAQALTIHRSREAAETVAAASDLTNDLLRANAENLRQANAETRRQIERGVFDIEAVAEANRNLIATIEDSLRIADEGRAARAKAATELVALEDQLRQSLAAASAREQQTPSARG